jgi:hypothetical protein
MNKEQEEKRNFIKQLIIIVLTGILIIGTIITTFVIVGKNRYNEAIKNPPDFNWLEEDLEDVFMTKFVDVPQEHIDFEKRELYCVAKANGLYYKVHYVLVVRNFVNWEWKYDRYIQISEVEDC